MTEAIRTIWGVALVRLGELREEHARGGAGRALEAPRLLALLRLLRLLLALLLEREAGLDTGECGQEERRLLGRLWRLFGFVALLDDFEVEERLPAGAREKGECDELAIKLWWGGEHICRLVLHCQC